METGSNNPVFVRRSTSADFAALARLALLSASPMPRGAYLIAEVGGTMVAAVSLDVAETPLFDPQHDTTDICSLLSKWGANLRREPGAADSLAA